MTAPDAPAPEDDAPGDAADVAVDPGVRRRCLTVLIGMALGVVVLDQLVKAWVVATLQPRLESGEGPVVLLGGPLKLTYVENTGAAFSIGAGYTWIFSIVAVVVAVVILRTARRLGSLWWAVALGGLLGLVEDRDHLVAHPGGEGVELVGTVQRDGGDTVIDAVEEGFEGLQSHAVSWNAARAVGAKGCRPAPIPAGRREGLRRA